MPQTRQYQSHAERQKAYRERCRQAVAEQLATKGLPQLPAISTIPGEHRWSAALQAVNAMLRSMVQEMTQYYEERSEEWQEGERGEAFEQRLEERRALLEQIEEALADTEECAGRPSRANGRRSA